MKKLVLLFMLVGFSFASLPKSILVCESKEVWESVLGADDVKAKFRFYYDIGSCNSISEFTVLKKEILWTEIMTSDKKVYFVPNDLYK